MIFVSDTVGNVDWIVQFYESQAIMCKQIYAHKRVDQSGSIRVDILTVKIPKHKKSYN